MKIITLHTRINIDELLRLIAENLNPRFSEQRKVDIRFIVKGSGNVIEITQPDLYGEDILFRIEVKGMALNITRSEHYVDDVNSLTVESILNELFNSLSGKPGTDLVMEG
ncbi:MAG: hypothetical protein ACXVB0_05300 [Mucilaginibacter sp.]